MLNIAEPIATVSPALTLLAEITPDTGATMVASPKARRAITCASSALRNCALALANATSNFCNAILEMKPSLTKVALLL